MKKNLFFPVLLVLAVQFFTSQEKYTMIAEFGADKGLSSNHAYDTTQDSRGFIWIATDNGISRFDGHGFQRYTVENGLPSNEVLQIFTDSKGRLWANCYMKPLAYFDEKFNRFVIYKRDEIFSNNLWTYKLNFRNNYQAFYKGIYIEIDGMPHIQKKVSGFPLNARNAFLKRYYTENNHLNIEIEADGKLVTRKIAVNFRPAYSFYFMQNIYVLTEGNDLHQFEIRGNQFSITNKTMHFTKKVLHFSFAGKMMNVVFQDGSVSIINPENFKPVGSVSSASSANSAFLDRDANIWLTTVDGGVQLYKKTPVRTLNLSRYKTGEMQSVRVSDGEIYSASYSGQIFRNSEPLVNLKRLVSGEKNVRVNDIIFTSRHKVMISDHFLLKDEKKMIVPPRTLISAIKSSLPYNDTTVILGTSNGLFGYNPQNDSLTRMTDYEQRILNLAADESGNILFTNSNQIFKTHLKARQAEMLPISSYFKDDFISGLQIVGPDLLWVSTYRGNLLLFKNLKLISKLNYKNGISNNIRAIKATGKSVWIGTHTEGLIKMDYTLTSGKLHYALNYINTTHGLSSNTVNSIDFKKDSVVVATTKGISVISATLKLVNRKTVPVIVQTKIDGDNAVNSSEYHLKKDQHSISFLISNVDFDNLYSRIQYAIDEPTEWINLPENVLNLEIASGEKTVFIRSMKRNNTEASDVISVKIIKDKYFYESYWFWLLTGGAIIGLTVFLRSKRAMQKQRLFYEKELERQKLLQRERERISTDMHDDLGASITALRFQAEFLKRKIGNETLQNDVDDLLTTSQEIHKSMREMLWNLNAENDNLGNFTTYIENYAKVFFQKSDVQVRVETKNIEPDRNISSEARRNMFLCLKEALNNILKHSAAKNAEVKIEQDKDRLLIQITDDGIGIHENHKKGNGLRNMEHRMTTINGKFTVLNSLKGTRLICEMPI